MSTLSRTPAVSYVEWSAVMAGTVLACTVSVILFQFGNGLGLSVAGARGGAEITAGTVMLVALWLFWVQLMASMAGAYLAGRMRGPWEVASHESEIRDGVHGLLVWVTSTLVTIAAVSVAALLAASAACQGAALSPEMMPEMTMPDMAMPLSPDMLRRSGIIFGFGMAAASLVSGLAAWWMGTVGGDHRDRNADAGPGFPFRRGS